MKKILIGLILLNTLAMGGQKQDFKKLMNTQKTIISKCIMTDYIKDDENRKELIKLFKEEKKQAEKLISNKEYAFNYNDIKFLHRTLNNAIFMIGELEKIENIKNN